MRKALTTIIALALVLGMTQCKKKDVIAPISNDGLFITFSANSNQGNTKTEFDPNSYHKFVWSSGVEYVNVGGSVSGYLGQISGDGKNDGDTEIHRKFSGSITTPQEGETLYFFYLGKGDHAGATSIDFADQTGNLSDVTNKHIAIGRTAYTGQTDFTATLNMAMSIACFNTEDFVDGSNNPETVYLYGEDIFSSANINYTNGTISGNAKSYICTGKANEERYVALIPGTANNPVSTRIDFVSESHGGSIYFNGGIDAQVYYAHTSGEPGLEVAIDPSAPGFVPYAFSVSSTKKVRFAKGNLQYKPSTGTWRFAEHQYDICVGADEMTYRIKPMNDYYHEWIVVTPEEYWAYVETAENDPDITHNYYYEAFYDATSMYASSGTSWIELFGWGTWGPGKTPYLVSIDNSDYSWSGDFSGTISNDDATGWYTLSIDEWTYLFTGRDNAASKYGFGTVAGVNGLIVLPDSFTDPNKNGGSNAFVPKHSDSSFDDNVYALENWAYMESAGAAFLPSSGLRADFEGPIITMIGQWGTYWSRTPINDNTAYGMISVDGNRLWLVDNGDCRRHLGNSVRLVRDVE